MAQYIQANGTVTRVTPAYGAAFSLQEMQSYVGGYIEALQLRDGRIMFLNEDGKRLDLAYNAAADIVAHQRGGLPPYDHIVGNVLITSRAEAGEDDNNEL